VSLVLRNVFAKTLRDQRRSLGWWSLGLVAVVAVYVLPYRQFLDSGMLDNNTDTPIYQALGYDNSPAGYLQGTLFALLGPLLVVMMAVAAGARAVAGDEEAGTLDLLLAHPVSRTRLVIERFGALAAAVTLLGLLVWAAAVAAVAAADMGIGAGRLAAATLGLVLLALGFGTVALAAGAASGHRGLTLGVTAAVAVAAYLAHTVAPRSTP
jgi:ABC-2 type transport system permease protein